MYAVIMAGGGGTRLWPKSRESFPKQMHPLAGPKPLVQEMTERLQGVVGDENVYIVTNAHHAGIIRQAMPFMGEHIFIDPYRRDTAAAIGLSAVYLSEKDPNAVMSVFPADHYIGNLEEFHRIVRIAGKLAEDGSVVTIGIKPTAPETGYGYIEAGEEFGEYADRKVYRVKRFVEKPDRERAEQYLASGSYLWNSGMFAWSIPTVLRLFEECLPDTYERLMRIRESIGTPSEAEVTNREYEQMQRISVDYGIMERLSDILVIPGDFGWNDIGSWTTVKEIAEKDGHGNVVKAMHIGLDTQNCLVVSNENKVVATIGVEDLIVVDTPDALLICHKDRTQDVKKIVDRLKESEMEGYL